MCYWGRRGYLPLGHHTILPACPGARFAGAPKSLGEDIGQGHGRQGQTGTAKDTCECTPPPRTALTAFADQAGGQAFDIRIPFADMDAFAGVQIDLIGIHFDVAHD